MGGPLLDHPQVVTLPWQTYAFTRFYVSLNTLYLSDQHFWYAASLVDFGRWSVVPPAWAMESRCCSDGIITVIVETSPVQLSVDIDMGTRKKAFRLTRPVHRAVEQILHDPGHIIETNGSFLLLLSYQEDALLTAGLSLRDGQFVFAYRVPEPRPLLGAVFDSINGCHWALYLVQGTVELRRVRAVASVNPYLLSPTCWPNNIRSHYIGLPVLPVKQESRPARDVWADKLSISYTDCVFQQISKR
jgi:hypothetical protein